MSGFEQSQSELGGKTKQVPERKEASLAIFGSIESKAREKANAMKKEMTLGSKKYIEEGILFRILGINILDMSKLNNRDIISYNFGYYEASNILLHILCQGIIPERLSKIIKRKKISLDRELYPEELLQEIGSRDREDNNIDINNMPELVKNDANYLKGYNRKTR